jgi:hypothetical protein
LTVEIILGERIVKIQKNNNEYSNNQNKNNLVLAITFKDDLTRELTTEFCG